MDDAALLALVRADDPAGWRALVDQYEGTVAAVVAGMLGPGDEADDVGQETFIRFFRSLDRFRGEASIRTWLQRIAINLSLNALKRRKRGLRRLLRIEDVHETTEQLQFDGRAAQDSQVNIALVRAAVGTLPDKYRAVVVLRMIEGCSTRETAELLGVPEGTVLSRLARAMDQMRQRLAPLVPDEGKDATDG